MPEPIDTNRRRSHDMNRCLATLIALCALAAPVLAQQSKLDQAIAKADEQVQKGKPDDAVKTLTKAAAENGAQGQVALARLQERLGNLEAAAAAYGQATSSASGAGASDILAAAANFTLRKGKAEDALKMAQRALQAGQTPAALAALARAQVRMQDGPAALATADKAVAAGPNDAMAHVARAEALLAIGRDADAEAEARKAVQADPKSALAQARLALALVKLKRGADAVVAGKHATELDDKLGEAFAAHGLALVAADPQKNWSEAIAQAQQGNFLDPENPNVQNAVAKIFEVNGQLEQAAAAYRRALQADPKYGPARVALIQAELNRGNRDAALAEARQLPPPVPPEINRLIGEDAARRGDWAVAIPFLEKATQGMQSNADGWALLGRAYHAARRYEDAADAFGKAVELAPTNIGYRTTYGLILGQAGELDKGLAQLLKVTGTPGYKDAAGWTNLGWVYRNMDKPQESIAAYQRALQLDPKQEQAALGLGWAYSYTKDFDKAIAAYQQAIQIDPKEAGPDANLGIAWAYVFKRQPAPAKEFSAKAAAAGRNVTALNTQIDRVEKAIASGQALTEEAQKQMAEAQQQAEEANKKIEAANRKLGSKNPATRSTGCREVAALAGGGAVTALVQLIQTDSSYDVRIACTNALGSLGAAGRPAVRNVEAMMKLPPYQAPASGASPTDLDNEMKDGDFKRALRDALQKIR
jgi:tetratricopeptide (TPR) repeat protein